MINNTNLEVLEFFFHELPENFNLPHMASTFYSFRLPQS